MGAEGKELFSEMEEWADHLRSLGRKETTICTHKKNVARCLTLLDEHGRPTRAAEITSDDIQFLYVALMVSPTVRRAYLRSLSNMIEYFTKVDLVKQSGLQWTHKDSEQVFITNDQFASSYRIANPLQRVILLLGGFMGLRRQEMAELRDSDLNGNQLTIRNTDDPTGQHDVVLTAPDSVVDAIQKYRESFMREGIRVDDYLLQVRGHYNVLHRIGANRISDQVRMLGDCQGFLITTQSLRRFYATMAYYEAGCDINELKEMLRHACVETTMNCYVAAYKKNQWDNRRKLDKLMEGLIENPGPADIVPDRSK